MLILKGAIAEDAGGKSIIKTSLVAKAVADVANTAAPAAVVRLRNRRRVPWILDAVGFVSFILLLIVFRRHCTH
jgi:hypothetical protein